MQGKGGELQVEPMTAAAGWSLACLGHEGPPITRMLYLTQHPPALLHHLENKHPQLLEFSRFHLNNQPSYFNLTLPT